jgi:hypothetical protein
MLGSTCFASSVETSTSSMTDPSEGAAVPSQEPTSAKASSRSSAVTPHPAAIPGGVLSGSNVNQNRRNLTRPACPVLRLPSTTDRQFWRGSVLTSTCSDCGAQSRPGEDGCEHQADHADTAGRETPAARECFGPNDEGNTQQCQRSNEEHHPPRRRGKPLLHRIWLRAERVRVHSRMATSGSHFGEMPCAVHVVTNGLFPAGAAIAVVAAVHDGSTTPSSCCTRT